jgi:hypothetical protein
MITPELVEEKLGKPAPEEPDGNYEFHYKALLDWFQSQEKWSANRVMLGCLAVYGWMPRILEVGRSADRCLTFARANDVAKKLNDGTASIDPPFVNQSIVGTSKFLHFWNPNEFAIWDSRVRRGLKLNESV